MRESRQAELVDRFFALREKGSTSLSDAVYRMPAGRYVDAAHAETERRRLFRSRPVFVCLSGEVPGPGDYLTADVAGCPVVVIRGADGVLRALVNACRHRGAPVFDGRGHMSRRAVTCPFHSWVYDQSGRLLGQPQSSEGFTGCDRAALSLHKLPVLERHGLVFVTPLDAGGASDADIDPLGSAAAELAAFDLAGYRCVDSRTRTVPANWKLVMDSFLEAYHIRSLHADSIGPYYFSTPSLFEPFDDVGLLVGVRSTITELCDVTGPERRLLPHATIQYFLPPTGIVVHQIDHVESWTVSPGRTPHEAVCTTCAHVPAGANDDSVRRSRLSLDRLLAVTDEEDFPLTARIQQTLAGGALAELVFGRNEPALVHFHETLDRMIGAA